MTRQSPLLPAKLKYSTILWFMLLLLYHFLVIFCVLNSPRLLSFHLTWPSNDLQATFPLDPLDKATILSDACNLDIIFNSYSSPRCHFPVILKLHTHSKYVNLPWWYSLDTKAIFPDIELIFLPHSYKARLSVSNQPMQSFPMVYVLDFQMSAFVFSFMLLLSISTYKITLLVLFFLCSNV